MSKNDLVDLAKLHGLFPLQHGTKVQRIHKSIILQEFFSHESYCQCNITLHFIELFNHMLVLF